MPGELKFQWDAANLAHIARHRVMPAEAEQVLASDPIHLDYDIVDGEERWTSIGHTESVRVLVVVWTIRDHDAVRVVTAWEAHKRAHRNYLREKGFAV